MTHYSIQSRILVGGFELLHDKIAEANVSDILVITSKSLVRHGAVLVFVNFLKSRYSVNVFSSLEPEAPVDQLDEILIRFSRPGIIIGIGGGSVMDAAKALSVGWQGNTISEFLYRTAKLPQDNIPLMLAPSTAGTGAELSFGAIIYDRVKNFKGGIRSAGILPEWVLINTELYQTASARLKAEVGFDCLTHAVETYLSKSSNAYVRQQSVAVIATVFHHLENATHGSPESIEKMAIAASLMGVNLAYSTTCLPHRIQYIIGPLTKTSHAQGLIALYKGWLPQVSTTTAFKQLNIDLKPFGIDLLREVPALKMRLDIDYSLTTLGVEKEKLDWIAGAVEGILNADPCFENTETIKNILINAL
ncbi:MAG: iron-containing alcohol dehydrogenase [Crocinitomicaceae bacterium]|nr:iron-containing alcohol dehydrogenase [Crocinitomicaceae bacterium]